jgi:hypothetical protein
MLRQPEPHTAARGGSRANEFASNNAEVKQSTSRMPKTKPTSSSFFLRQAL